MHYHLTLLDIYRSLMETAPIALDISLRPEVVVSILEESCITMVLACWSMSQAETAEAQLPILGTQIALELMSG